uniref:DNA-directed DNA polymerase n=1 Tax=Heterorhabditis bacteriophora TaxID=37862 RepID=A0A1I7XQI5_HETBA
MQRAYHRTELETNSNLKIDVHYYLAQQVHPVVSRLCAPIDETDAVRIAEALVCTEGIDSSSYRRSAAAHAVECDAMDNELAWQEPVTYDHCESLVFPCPTNCGHILHIRTAIEKRDSSVILSLESCDKCGCNISNYSSYVCNRFDNSLNDFIAQYMSSAFKCDDTVCEFRTHVYMLKWNREGLECPRCNGGILRKEYTAKDLFDQQMFLKQIVDLQKCVEDLRPEQRSTFQHGLMEEDGDTDFEMSSETNKKYTIFWVDGGENMFVGGEGCDFRIALKVRLVLIYQHRGVETCFSSRLSVSQRHQSIIYLTNDKNPFGSEWNKYIGNGYFNRMLKGVRSFLFKNRIRTQADFSVVLMHRPVIQDNNEMNEKDIEVWQNLDPHICISCEAQDIESQVYRKTFSLRTFSNVTLELGPGVKFGVGVYALVDEVGLPTKYMLDKASENILETKQLWVTKEVPNLTANAVEGNPIIMMNEEREKYHTMNRIEKDCYKHELKKMTNIGGECIINKQREIEIMGRFDAKGILLLGFQPISSINLELHIQPSRFLYPNDNIMLGSVRIYRALLDKCWERQMAMICRFCSRNNQKVKLVALIPHKSQGEEERRTWGMLRKIDAFQYDGFHIVFLPFVEDIRNISKKMLCSKGQWPKPSAFVKKLKATYNPAMYKNPRLQSFYAMITENILGEKIIEPTDTLLPYYTKKEWLERASIEMDAFVGHFTLHNLEHENRKCLKRSHQG